MAIGPLSCSLMSASLFHTLMMEVTDIGEIIDRVCVPTRQCSLPQRHGDVGMVKKQ